MLKLTRIAYNTSDWKRPSGDAPKYEARGTHNRKYGFGHEEWLFRDEWRIDGWRYAFIQGVNKGFRKLMRAAQPIDITVFTLEPNKKRRYVATIEDLEVLNDRQARDAVNEFRQLGWLAMMRYEILAVGGKVQNFDAPKTPRDILNVRFRLENVRPFPPATFATANDPVSGFWRYQLYDDGKIGSSKPIQVGTHQGSTQLPRVQPFQRKAVASVLCTPEHSQIQGKLMQLLKVEYPGAKIVREKHFIDVSVETGAELLLFEIKCDLDPRAVIRLALGQILEYAYHPTRIHSRSVRLVIVGQKPLGRDERAYLDHLRTAFNLPIDYRAVPI